VLCSDRGSGCAAEALLRRYRKEGHPDAGEVIFADDARQAHARRWTNRQSGASAVRDTTTTALIVTEALHDTAASDVPALQATLADALGAAWSATAVTAVLTQSTPRTLLSVICPALAALSAAFCSGGATGH